MKTEGESIIKSRDSIIKTSNVSVNSDTKICLTWDKTGKITFDPLV